MNPCIHYTPDFIADHHRWFAELVSVLSWDTRMQARATASFGVAYNYSNMTYPDVPMPDPIRPWAAQIETHVGHSLNNCLVNHYLDGASTMGFHFDAYDRLRPDSFICILSLGAPRTLRFRSRADSSVTYDQRLTGGSLLTMDRAVQEKWMHGILPSETRDGRISLTFRSIVTAA